MLSFFFFRMSLGFEAWSFRHTSYTKPLLCLHTLTRTCFRRIIIIIIGYVTFFLFSFFFHDSHSCRGVSFFLFFCFKAEERGGGNE